MDPVLRIENLTKRFGHVLANDNISLIIEKGEIHCLLGENGAGKSTLAECLFGYYQPDSGKIYLDNELVEINSPSDAADYGIGMVHQHFVLVQPMTVIENVIAGLHSISTFLDLTGAEKKLKDLCDKYCLELDLHAKIWQLSVGEQQWVEILKALYVDSRILILDEPTAVLTPQETDTFFDILIQMKNDGISIILITHKLKEVMDIADKVTVLKKGKFVITTSTKGMKEQDLAKLMVGREVVFTVIKDEISIGKPILEISGLSALNDRGLPALREVSLNLHKNEILGVAGVAGNGQKELFEVIAGLRNANSGKVILNGEEITNIDADTIMKKGVGHIPDDRIAEGLIPEFSISENLILGQQRSKKFKKGLFLNTVVMEENAEKCISDFEIATPSSGHITKLLSGGNLQKVILAREFQISSKVLLANQPTRGLDVGVIEYVHKRLLEKRREGIGIILVSEDLDELFSLSDRIAVIYDGRIVDIFDAENAKIGDIGICMAGMKVSCNDE